MRDDIDGKGALDSSSRHGLWRDLSSSWSLLSEDLTTIAWSAHFAAALLFLGLVGSGLASWVWDQLVRKGELISLNSLTLLTPVFALLLALAIYREPLSALSVFGMVMVLAGVVWAGWPRGPVAVRAEPDLIHSRRR